MIKKSLLILAVLFTAGLAHADDSAFPRIDVKGINPGPMPANSSMSFYGKNADDFFKMLPAVKSVDPKQDLKDQKVMRELVIVSSGHALRIYCAKIVFNQDGQQSPNPKGTECTLTINNAKDLEGDSYQYKPADVLAPKPAASKLK